MLMPLIYMKSVFGVNYSRKLSSLKNRQVVIPSDQELSVAHRNTYLYWQWAFESPPSVKLLVRQELGEENAPQASQALTGSHAEKGYVNADVVTRKDVPCTGNLASLVAPHLKASHLVLLMASRDGAGAPAAHTAAHSLQCHGSKGEPQGAATVHSAAAGHAGLHL